MSDDPRRVAPLGEALAEAHEPRAVGGLADEHEDALLRGPRLFDGTRAIGVLIQKYFRPGTVVQAGYPLDMRYAGPREALLHALFRQNYGCSHLVIGRDRAGVGSYYGPFDAHRIFDEIPRDALETRPIRIGVTFWCYRCKGMASDRTCPHGDADRLQVSGTRLRKWLAEGTEVPPEFSRPEVLEVLRAYYSA